MRSNTVTWVCLPRTTLASTRPEAGGIRDHSAEVEPAAARIANEEHGAAPGSAGAPAFPSSPPAREIGMHRHAGAKIRPREILVIDSAAPATHPRERHVRIRAPHPSRSATSRRGRGTRAPRGRALGWPSTRGRRAPAYSASSAARPVKPGPTKLLATPTPASAPSRHTSRPRPSSRDASMASLRRGPHRITPAPARDARQWNECGWITAVHARTATASSRNHLVDANTS